MRNILLVPVLAFELLAGTAMAQTLTFPSQALKVNGPTPNDLARASEVEGVKRLRKTDEEHTNEQAVVQLFADGKLGIYVEMRSSELAGTLPTDKVQGACTPIELVQGPGGSVTAIKRPGERWVTDNDGNESRNAHHPWLVPVGPTEMLYTFNHQAEGTSDTKRYGMILTPDCTPRTLLNSVGTPIPYVIIMEKDNDDCSMNEDGGGADTRLMLDGSTRVVMWAGCNGNGRDDGWLNVVDVKCIDDIVGRTCRITKQFDVSLAKREERSRGRCSMSTADPDTAVCTWTEGNNQPQRDGTWIAAVDVSGSGPAPNDGEGRVLWKKLIEGRKAIPPTQSVNPNPNEEMEGRGESKRSYSSRAKSARVLALDGANNVVQTDLLFVSTGDLVGNNLRDGKGGRYIDSRLGVARATRQGLEWVVPMQSVSNALVGFDYTHIKMTGVLIQNDGQVLPGVTFLQGSHNGGGVHPPDVKVIAFDQAEARLIDYGTYQAKGTSYDRHLYSNYLGNNPGNQGRNFAGAAFVKNPFEGLNGSRTKFLVLHALTGKDPADVAAPEKKPSSYLSVMELILDGAPPPPVPGLNGTGTPPPTNGPMSCSSCSTTGGEGALGLWGTVLALIAARRRRSRGEGAHA